MHDDTLRFLNTLLSRCPTTADLCLTLTALHPNGQHPTPSRHIPLNQPHVLQEALMRLESANACGWGAFFGVGLRKAGLGRYRRGGLSDIALLPALFVDIDNPTKAVLQRLEQIQPLPSCIVSSGGGFHAYWWLEQPTEDLAITRVILRGLARSLGGDSLSPAQSLRLIGTCNTKPSRHNALCELVLLSQRAYSLSDFAQWNTPPSQAVSHIPLPVHYRGLPTMLNPDLIQRVEAVLTNAGYRLIGDWLKGPCLFPHKHHHADDHPSFGFNCRTGYGHCFRCGSVLLKEICHVLHLDPRLYGGLCCRA